MHKLINKGTLHQHSLLKTNSRLSFPAARLFHSQTSISDSVRVQQLRWKQSLLFSQTH